MNPSATAKQSADVRPDPNFQRKAAIASGAAVDHHGKVRIEPIPQFDLSRTIFDSLKGRAARYIMKTRVGKQVYWNDDEARKVQAAYEEARANYPLPEVDPELMKFMLSECDFDVEHADGSFLDHLYFCFEYGVQHYPQESALVLLLHSILGTGTNTFAMKAEKIPDLSQLMTPAEWKQTEAFPSVLRLLYSGGLRQELRRNASRAGELKSIRLHRVIDNAELNLSGDELWVALNYQLIHLVDFLPVANWRAHQNDTSFIVFRDLYDLLGLAGKRDAKIGYTPARGPKRLEGESHGLGGRLLTLIPVSAAERMADRSIARFSQQIGHSLDYRLEWN